MATTATTAAVAAALDQLPPVRTVLAKIAAEVGAVSKSDVNRQQGFNFRGIDSVLNACAPVLHKHGVVVVPEVVAQQWETVEVGSGEKRRAMRSCVLTIRYRFTGPAGDHVDAIVLGEAMDAGDKAASKAQSVALRVALLQVLALPTHEKDPDADTYERAPAEPRPPASRSGGQTPIMAVIGLARQAGCEGAELAAEVASRHDGKALGDLTEAQLRLEWKHWRAVVAGLEAASGA